MEDEQDLAIPLIVEEVTTEELWAEFDRRARAELGMSAEEFEHLYLYGDWDIGPTENQLALMLHSVIASRVPA